MWNSMMTDLETTICQQFGVKYGIFTGNGTTAMYLAFCALGLQKKKVIFPAISCTNPVNAAIFAGYEVEFCDVQLKDYTIDLIMLNEMLSTGKYGIVVPTHIYGHRYDEVALRRLCEYYGAILFEDAAQSYYVGDMDVAVMSFGHTKVCETSLGGGIALTNDYELAKKIRSQKMNLCKSYNPVMQLFDQYREKYYRIVRENNDWKDRNKKLRELQLDSKQYFILDLNDNEKIYDKLRKLGEMVELRRKKVELYQQCLNDKFVLKPEVEDLFRWRYTFLYKGNRDRLLNRAREQGIDISSWYYSLAGIYQGRHLKNADILENQVVNLWVDETHSIENIKQEINTLNGIMEEEYAGSE